MGWHKEMLLHLFIRRIEIRDPEDPNIILKKYVNYPGDPNLFADFQKQIRIKDWEWSIEKDEATSIGEVDASEASKLKKLIEVQKAGLTLISTSVKDNKKKDDDTPSTEEGDANNASQLKKLIEAKKTGSKLMQDKKNNDEENNKMKLCLSKVEYHFKRVATKCYKKTEKERIKHEKIPPKEKLLLIKLLESPHIKVYLRSPEAILYYLGEILRAEIRGEKKGKKNFNIPIIYAGIGECEGTKSWLFYARKVTGEDDTPCVSVDYEGSRYVIPGRSDTKKGCCRDRSMHVLSLVSLLIGQQKESKLVPTTATVSVIGQ
jgi:hypothetical protein